MSLIMNIICFMIFKVIPRDLNFILFCVEESLYFGNHVHRHQQTTEGVWIHHLTRKSLSQLPHLSHFFHNKEIRVISFIIAYLFSWKFHTWILHLHHSIPPSPLPPHNPTYTQVCDIFCNYYCYMCILNTYKTTQIYLVLLMYICVWDQALGTAWQTSDTVPGKTHFFLFNGNYLLIASRLEVGPCGISPTCCWHDTGIVVIWEYLGNRIVATLWVQLPCHVLKKQGMFSLICRP